MAKMRAAADFFMRSTLHSFGRKVNLVEKPTADESR